jgi:hypothetical protein
MLTVERIAKISFDKNYCILIPSVAGTHGKVF